MFLFVSLSLYWFWESGRFRNLETSLSQGKEQIFQTLGLSLQNVYIEGRERTSRQEILDILGVKRGDYIFRIDLQETYQKLKKLRWVASIMIERRLPSTIYIRMVEKRPLAYWQCQQKYYLIDTQGNLIEETSPQEFPDFIVATGGEAPKALPKLLSHLHKYPEIEQQVNGVIYVSQRRWDLLLKSGLRIKLPDDKLEESLKLLTKLANEKHLKKSEVKTIDLRNLDRIYFHIKDGVLEKVKDKVQSKNA